MEKREAKTLRRFLLKGTYPDSSSKNEKRALRVKAESFTVVDRVLYHVRKNKGEQRVVIGKEKAEILEALHQGVGGAHFGVNSTMVKISERYWWKGMSADILDYCKHCEACQRANPLSKPPPSRLHPIKVSNELFGRWGIDLVGPLKLTENGNRYLICATEYLSKYAEVAAIPDKTATTVADFVLKLVYRYGCMQKLHHDQGREFCNKLNEEICERLQIKNSITSAYRPQSNGLTEKFNGTLTTGLKKVANENCDDWDEKYANVVFAYNTRQQKSTKKVPFEVLYSVKPRLPTGVSFPESEGTVGPIERDNRGVAIAIRRRDA